MAVPKKKTSKTRTRTRRSHHAIKRRNFVKCKNCGASMLPHRACSECGFINGKMVIDTRSRKEIKQEKRKAREKRTKTKKK